MFVNTLDFDEDQIIFYDKCIQKTMKPLPLTLFPELHGYRLLAVKSTNDQYL